MRRCIVHFGMNKTGSSSIQSTLFNCSLNSAFHYIDLGVDNPTGPVLSAFMLPKRRFKSIQSRSRRVTLDKFKKKRNLIIRKLRAQLESTSSPNIILSAEGLWRLTEKELSSLYEFIRPYVDEFQAVAYIRSPKSFMESNFQQLVKGNLGELSSAVIYPHYRERFEKFDNVFGPENVQYWEFSPNTFKDNCVVKDFCNRLSIPLEDSNVRRVNEGMSRGATSVLFAYRKFYEQFPERDWFNRENAQLVNKLYELPGDKFRFSSKLVAPVLKAQHDDLRWIESRLGSSLSEDLDKHDEDAVVTESDILSFDKSAIHWLTEQLEIDYVQNEAPSPKEVAEWVHRLRIKLADYYEGKALEEKHGSIAKGENINVNIKKIIRKAQKDYPSLSGDVLEQEVLPLVKDVFKHIIEEIDATDNGVVNISDLGKFAIRKVQRSSEGSAAVEKRIVFTTQPLLKKQRKEKLL